MHNTHELEIMLQLSHILIKMHNLNLEEVPVYRTDAGVAWLKQ